MSIDISKITLPEDFHKVSDFYLPEIGLKYAVMYPGAILVGERSEYTEIVETLLKEAKQQNKVEFSLYFMHEGMRVLFRGHTLESVEGKVFILRRLPSSVPSIRALGMPEPIVDLLSSPALTQGGLVIIAGETGQGKSTTAAAAVSYRLKKYGSFCLSIEDPIEMPLQGFHYNEADPSLRGVCMQSDVDENSIGEAIKGAMRCYPATSNSILFLGETRTPLMAAEVLKVAMNGHLLITTFHSADLMLAIRRFVAMASSSGIGDKEANAIFASAFKLIIHQKMDVTPTGAKKIRPKVLFSTGANSSIAARLRSGSLEMLATDIQMQNMIVSRGGSLLNESSNGGG